VRRLADSKKRSPASLYRGAFLCFFHDESVSLSSSFQFIFFPQKYISRGIFRFANHPQHPISENKLELLSALVQRQLGRILE
jgi:hypothetical protein